MNNLYRYFLALGLIAGFSLLSQRDASAQDEDILDLIPFAAFTSKFLEHQTILCKEIFEELDCGDGSGGFVDNFYVVFIDEESTPSKNPLSIFTDPLTPNAQSRPFEASDCDASSIQRMIVGFSDLPVDLQNSLMIPPGKRAVFHRVRVTNGNRQFPIRVLQFCEDPQSP
ncbi:MAG: hypothetical protein HKN85_07455 [Gammaproteobacteria bacterium]|nr:hypothetical protein [Gammaproteobacteria bacterium]